MAMKHHYCNLCGKSFDFWDEQEDFSIHKELGYGTNYDGDTLKLHLCCECMNKIVKECKISPIISKQLFPPEHLQEYSS